jgi:dipeptidyl aminopeptidase/acylaminoacyl peptidase
MSKLSWNEKSFAQFVTLSDVRISSDNSAISYVMSRADLQGDKYESGLVLKGAMGEEKDYIPSASLPRFSPDGRRLVYISHAADSKGLVVWTYDIRSATTRKLLENEGIVDADWSPDGTKLCVVSGRKMSDPHLHFDDGYPIWYNGRGFLDREYTIVNIYDAESGARLEQIERRMFLMPKLPLFPYFRVALWHRDSLLLNVFNPKSPFRSVDIYSYKDGKEDRVFEDVAFRAVSSNGQYVVLCGKPSKRSGYSEHDFLYVWDGSHLRPLTDRYIYEDVSTSGSEPKFDRRGRLYYASLRRGRITLHSITVGGIERSEIEEDAQITSFDVSSSGRIVLIKDDPTHPPEVYAMDKKLRKLTSYNSALGRELGLRPLHKLNYKGAGGLGIDAWYLKPNVKEGAKAPVILFIHGGPKGMYGYFFQHLHQLLASRGYFVIYANPRGSGGYDEAFANAVNYRYGDDDFGDLMKGLDGLTAKESSADKDRMAVTGISGGGFLTNWAITHTDRFRAAISENGICNWFSEYAYSDIGYWFTRQLIGDDPFEDESYKLRSPLYRSMSVSTPVLFMHSYEDYRCTPDQPIMFHQVLKSLGKESYLAMFKKGDHMHSVLGSPIQRYKRHRLITEFFDSKLVKGEKSFSPSFIANGSEL